MEQQMSAIMPLFTCVKNVKNTNKSNKNYLIATGMT